MLDIPGMLARKRIHNSFKVRGGYMPETTAASLPQEPFGHTGDGTAATLYTLANDHLRVGITNYGGRLVSIKAPDRHGQLADVLLGFDTIATYASAGGSFGALLGRCANRIAGGDFVLGGVHYDLSRNDQGNTLHGGSNGFGTRFWDVLEAGTDPCPHLRLQLISPDGDQGFPGEVTAQATYRLEKDRLWLHLQARTTQSTIINLSVHPYFNLAGPGRTDVLAHEIMVDADAFLPTDQAQIPLGELRPVDNTVFDFRTPTTFAARIRQHDEQLLIGGGYDHCFALRSNGLLTPAARVHEPDCGRILEVYTDQPGLQVYTGNKLDGSITGHGGVIYRQSDGFALEPQAFPDAPHHEAFPSIVLHPGETYTKVACYRFYAV